MKYRDLYRQINFPYFTPIIKVELAIIFFKICLKADKKRPGETWKASLGWRVGVVFPSPLHIVTCELSFFECSLSRRLAAIRNHFYYLRNIFLVQERWASDCSGMTMRPFTDCRAETISSFRLLLLFFLPVKFISVKTSNFDWSLDLVLGSYLNNSALYHHKLRLLFSKIIYTYFFFYKIILFFFTWQPRDNKYFLSLHRQADRSAFPLMVLSHCWQNRCYPKVCDSRSCSHVDKKHAAAYLHVDVKGTEDTMAPGQAVLDLDASIFLQCLWVAERMTWMLTFEKSRFFTRATERSKLHVRVLFISVLIVQSCLSSFVSINWYLNC